MPVPEQDSARLLQEVLRKQEELGAELKWLVHNQRALDFRLSRVEDSMVFRTLRAVGKWYSRKIARRKEGVSPGYAEWRKRGGGGVAVPAPNVEPRFTLLLPLAQPESDGLRRSIQSFTDQAYRNSELIAIRCADMPPWVSDVLTAEGIPVANSFAEALSQATGEFIGLLGERDALLPSALHLFAAAGPADLLYSDEEIVDGHGAPLRPVFKPEWSPVLGESVDYVGRLAFLDRRRVEAASSFEGAFFEGALKDARGIRAVHIPAVLYQSRARVPGVKVSARAFPASSDRVSILICTRTASLLQSCLRAIAETTGYGDYEVVVVQHLGSTSDAEEQGVARVIEQFHARRTGYHGPFNFSVMNNQGARMATGSILLFMNDDVEPLRADWLERMAGWLQNPGLGAVGAKLVYPDGTIQHAGIATWLINGAGHPGRGLRSSDNWPWMNYTREVTAVTGACLAIRKNDFERVGGFDPEFPVNYNDVDLCLKLRREGLSVIVDMETELRHSESQTRRPGTDYEERRRFFRKWPGTAERVDPYYSPHLAQNNEDLSLRLARL